MRPHGIGVAKRHVNLRNARYPPIGVVDSLDSSFGRSSFTAIPSLSVHTSPAALTTGRKITFSLVCWLVAAVLVTASGEVFARFRGHKAYQPFRAGSADYK